MNDEIMNVIREAAKETAGETVLKLKKAGLLKDDEKSAFKKTEELLRTYSDLKVINPEPGSATDVMLKKVDEALQALEGDEYCGLIQMIYVEGMTREECAEFYGVEPITITRNKKRLVEKMKNILFADDVIKELFL